MSRKQSAVFIAGALLLAIFITACGTPTDNTQTATTTTQNNGQTTIKVPRLPVTTGTATTQNNQGNTQNTPTQTTPAPSTNTGQNGNNNNTMQSTPTPATNNNNNTQTNPTTNGGTMTLNVRSITINGTARSVLTTSNGMTLYTRSSDPAPASSCTGTCAASWPPLLNNNMSIITSQNVNGKVTVVQTANGSQVEFNGHPLYTYVGDKAAGQATGHGVGGVWNVAQVQVAAAHW